VSKVEEFCRWFRRQRGRGVNGEGREEGRKTYPTKIGSSGARSISLLAINGRALYPRYVMYIYCIAAIRNKVLNISLILFLLMFSS
jgi:hypothetical protein